MGGLFGAVSKGYLARDLFFGVDYHSHLGTEVGSIAFLDEDIEVLTQDISNSQFKSEFQKHFSEIKGRLGIGVIGDREEDEPVKFVSKIGTFALCTSGLIRNAGALSSVLVENGTTLKRSRGGTGDGPKSDGDRWRVDRQGEGHRRRNRAHVRGDRRFSFPTPAFKG